MRICLRGMTGPGIPPQGYVSATGKCILVLINPIQYASIPQTDLFDRDDNPMDNAAEIDPEQADAEHVHLHNHGGQSNRNDNGNEADRNADPGQPHVHCTACDNLLERKERRLNQRHCCTMLAVTFTTAFLCLFFFGLAVALVKKK